MEVDKSAIDRLAREASQDTEHAPLDLDKPPLGLGQMGGKDEFLARLAQIRERSLINTSASDTSERPEKEWQPPSPERVRDLLLASGLTREERALSLETVRRYPHQEAAQMAFRQFLSEAAEGRQVQSLPRWWIVLCSRTKGTGKSYLAMALTADLCRLGIPTLHLWELDMLRLLRDAMGDKAEFGLTQLQERWLKPPVLVLDEMGDELPTEFSAREQYRLIEARCRRKRATVITTNLTEGGILRRYASAGNGVGEQAERMVSRIFGACYQGRTWIEMEGPDLRAGGEL